MILPGRGGGIYPGGRGVFTRAGGGITNFAQNNTNSECSENKHLKYIIDTQKGNLTVTAIKDVEKQLKR